MDRGGIKMGGRQPYDGRSVITAISATQYMRESIDLGEIGIIGISETKSFYYYMPSGYVGKLKKIQTLLSNPAGKFGATSGNYELFLYAEGLILLNVDLPWNRNIKLQYDQFRDTSFYTEFEPKTETFELIYNSTIIDEDSALKVTIVNNTDAVMDWTGTKLYVNIMSEKVGE